MISLDVESRKTEFIDTENRLTVVRAGGWRGGKWVKVDKRFKLPVIR